MIIGNVIRLSQEERLTFNYEIGTRASWAHMGNLNYGTIKKINRKTILVNESKTYSPEIEILVSKSLICEIIRF
jgi:hypothetical protein